MAALAAAPDARAQTITVLDGPGRISQTRDFERGGERASRWSTPASATNTAMHEGRGAGSYEDGGAGEISFGVKAGADGTAVAEFQDVGDTKAFKSFSINGQAIEIPEPRADGGVFRVLLDFGAAGWHQLVAITTLVADHGSRLDGFSARSCSV